MRTRLRLFLFAAAAVISASSFLTESSAQRGREQFSHNTKAHKTNCSSCHKMPTGNWVTARGYPDVADYPGHASCVGCHRNDFFRGNRPSICAGCHTNPGPSNARRFPFPVRSRSQEFSTIFPHDVHQNIIASNPKRDDVAVAHFVRVSFTKPADDPKPEFNNCAICHQTPAKEPKFADRNLLVSQKPLTEAAANTFRPTTAFFKDSPNTHASCFTCHYQNEKPISTNCAGCHRLERPYTESNVITRYSLKFEHQYKDHVNKDCTTCHVRITQTGDLRKMLDADVPILTCSTSSCHGDEIGTEITAREKSVAEKQPIFQCSYCHTSTIGSFPIPASHINR